MILIRLSLKDLPEWGYVFLGRYLYSLESILMKAKANGKIRIQYGGKSSVNGLHHRAAVLIYEKRVVLIFSNSSF